jgi:hypothetical protein
MARDGTGGEVSSPFYLTPQELLQTGVNYASVALSPPTIGLYDLRESAQHIREQAQQKTGV